MPVETQVKVKKFIDYLTDKNHTPHPSITYVLDNNCFAFSNNLFFKHNPRYLGADEFNRCTEIFKDRTPNGNPSEVDRILRIISSPEAGEETLHKLEQLCVKSIREMYDIPEQITLDVHIKPVTPSEMDDPEEDEEDEKIDPKRLPILKEEIEKRRILNSIVHGSAIHQWTSAFFIIQKELEKLNPALLDLYKQYASLVNYFNWQHTLSVDAKKMTLKGEIELKDGHMQLCRTQGFTSVDVDGRNIYAQGDCLPVAIHELSKGALEFIVQRGIPDYLPDNELKYVLKKADKLNEEFWHYYLGPPLFRAILSTANVEPHQVQKIISQMSIMKYSDLAELSLNIVFYPDTVGKQDMVRIKRMAGIKSKD